MVENKSSLKRNILSITIIDTNPDNWRVEIFRNIFKVFVLKPIDAPVTY